MHARGGVLSTRREALKQRSTMREVNLGYEPVKAIARLGNNHA
jgi:hypothetical protein